MRTARCRCSPGGRRGVGGASSAVHRGVPGFVGSSRPRRSVGVRPVFARPTQSSPIAGRSGIVRPSSAVRRGFVGGSWVGPRWPFDRPSVRRMVASGSSGGRRGFVFAGGSRGVDGASAGRRRRFAGGSAGFVGSSARSRTTTDPPSSDDRTATRFLDRFGVPRQTASGSWVGPVGSRCGAYLRTQSPPTGLRVRRGVVGASAGRRQRFVGDPAGARGWLVCAVVAHTKNSKHSHNRNG